jgi:hypothetical protein
MDALPAFRTGNYSSLFLKIVVGDILFSVFVFLLCAIFDHNKDHRFLDPIDDRWNERTTSETRGLNPSKSDDSDNLLDPHEEDKSKFKISGFSDSLFHHGFAVAIALATPLHSPATIALCGFHLLSLITNYLMTLRGVKLSWIPFLLCELANLVILALCIAEKAAQISLFDQFEALKSN